MRARTWFDAARGGAQGGIRDAGALVSPVAPAPGRFALVALNRAGDRLAARVGRLGFLAREVLDELPAVLAELD